MQAEAGALTTAIGTNTLSVSGRRVCRMASLGEALRSFFNIVGCALGGAHHEGVAAADNALAPFAGAAQATLLGPGHRADARWPR